MIIIAHRGNTKGGNPERENSPQYLEEALAKGYDAEVDVFYVSGKGKPLDGFWLGHDGPQYKVDNEFLKNPHLWIHAKTGPTLIALKRHFGKKVKYFFLEWDSYTIASDGTIWSYEGEDPYNECICVHPERPRSGKKKDYWKDAKGICTDFADRFAKQLES